MSVTSEKKGEEEEGTHQIMLGRLAYRSHSVCMFSA